ncbi:MAG: hypothetical protein PHQ89_03920 [Bacilli bacterium]|nr:hypothetical protein [Bacilli bacterium]
MNKYVEIKIKRKYIVMILLILVFACGLKGYYHWCENHPQIDIHISAGPTGKENIKMEAPHISIVNVGIAKPTATIELKCNSIVMQHEFFCTYIKDTYHSADIKLDVKTNGNETLIKYYGTATKANGETDKIEKEFNLDFTLDAKITKNN